MLQPSSSMGEHNVTNSKKIGDNFYKAENKDTEK